MSIAVVILNWNGEKYLEKFLPVLIQNCTSPDVEIIVADNASTDGSLKILETNFPEIQTIILDKNYGFAEGYNKALAQVKTDYYVLLNSDVEVTPGWLNKLVEYMDQHADVAACQPKILSYSNHDYFEHAGAAGGFIDRFGFPFCRGRVFGIVEKDEGQYNSVIDIFWATGACFMVRSDVYHKMGGLDADFFAHMEEIDFCWRLKSRGYRLVCVPESVVYHIGGGTLNMEHPHKTYLNFRNNLLMLYKNLPESLLEEIMFWRIIFDYAAAFQLFITGKPNNARSVIKAHADFKHMKHDFEDRRKDNIFYATTDNKEFILQKSIVLRYYFKGEKTYNILTKNKQ